MLVIKILKDYHRGIKIYDECHPASLRMHIEAFKDEVKEFWHEPNFGEMWDILHQGGRILFYLTKIPFYLIAFPTVHKHSKRFSEYGCIRSRRNCQKNCIDCHEKIIIDS